SRACSQPYFRRLADGGGRLWLLDDDPHGSVDHDSPAGGLTVLPMIRSAAVDAVHRKIVGGRAAIEDWFGRPRIAGEENALIAADRSAVHGSHLVPLRLERGADQVEQIRFERQHVRILIVR